MTDKQKAYRKNLLALIHTNRQYKMIKENGAWQDWLYLRYGVTSSAKLSIEQLNDALDRLAGRKSDKEEFESKITAPQMNAIKDLWQERAKDKSYGALARFCKRVVGVIPMRLSVLSKSQATKLIIALRKL